MDFHAIFLHQQRVLELELAIARERFAHYGVRGNAIEIAVRDFLQRHIPRSLNAGTGEVIAASSDTTGHRSGQVDIVISNMHQPFIGARDTPTTFMIEGVHAAGEVKSTLARSKVSEELVKARKFRSLRARNLSRLVQVLNADAWLSYYVFYRPYFLMTLETASPWQTILLEIMEFIKAHETIPLDGVFLVDKGITIVLSPIGKHPIASSEGIPFQHRVRGELKTGAIHVFNTDVPLAVFLTWLSLFRSSFFDDEQPMATYMESMLNENLKNLSVLETSESIEVLQETLQRLGMFDGMLQLLRAAHPKRSTEKAEAEREE